MFLGLCANTIFAANIQPIQLRQLGSFEITGSYVAFGPVISETGSVALSVPEKRTYRYDSRSRKLTVLDSKGIPIGSDPFSGQFGCGEGIISTFHPTSGDEGTMLSWNVEDGRSLRTVQAEWNRFRRVGPWVSGRTNLLTGATVNLSISDSVVWSDNDHLLLLGRNNRAPAEGPYFNLTMVRAKDSNILRQQLVGRYEQGFFQILGSPLNPPFAIEFGYVGVGVETYSYTVLMQNWSVQKRNYPKVWDASPIGILVSTNDNGYPSLRRLRYPTVSFVEAKAANVVWTAPAGKAAWLYKKYALIESKGRIRIYDAATGRVRGDLKLPGSVAARRGRYILFEVTSIPPRHQYRICELVSSS